jgi:hypothetical protein
VAKDFCNETTVCVVQFLHRIRKCLKYGYSGDARKLVGSKGLNKHSGGAVINMKKLFPFLMIVSVMGAILAGCGAKTEEAAGGDAAAPAAEAKTEEAK